MSYEIRVAGMDLVRDSRERWNYLVGDMKLPSIFCTWEWIYTWIEHFGRAYDPLILFVYWNQELVGILPLAIRTAFLDGVLVPVRVATYCSSMELAPDHIDIICERERAGSCLEVLFEFLETHSRKWDVLHLSHLATGGWLDEWVRCDKSKKACEIESCAVAPYMTLNGGLDRYMDGFSGKHRYNLRRARKQLQQIHGVRFAMFTGGAIENIQANLGDLFHLHHARKREVGINSSFAGSTVKGFHRDLAMRFGGNGWLRIGSLKTEDKCIAVAYGFFYRNRFSYYQTGFDPDWERYGVGTALLVELLEHGYKEGWSEFDFLRGNEDYKYKWSHQERQLSTANIYNRTTLGMLGRTSARVWKSAKRLVGDW